MQADELCIGISVALVDDRTAVLGLPDRLSEGDVLQLFRTTDGGAT